MTRLRRALALALLLLGSDDGPPRGGQVDGGNADGFQLLFVSGDRQHATFVSVPRDSYVQVPGLGRSRINTGLHEGHLSTGAEALVQDAADDGRVSP